MVTTKIFTEALESIKDLNELREFDEAAIKSMSDDEYSSLVKLVEFMSDYTKDITTLNRSINNGDIKFAREIRK